MSDGGLQFSLDLRDHQNAAVAGPRQKRCQDFAFARQAQILPSPPTGTLALTVTHRFARQKPVAQLASPTRGFADHLRGLLQTQAVGQWQYHCLRLPQFFNGLRSQNHLLRHFQYFRSAYWSGHRPTSQVVRND